MKSADARDSSERLRLGNAVSVAGKEFVHALTHFRKSAATNLTASAIFLFQRIRSDQCEPIRRRGLCSLKAVKV